MSVKHARRQRNLTWHLLPGEQRSVLVLLKTVCLRSAHLFTTLCLLFLRVILQHKPGRAHFWDLLSKRKRFPPPSKQIHELEWMDPDRPWALKLQYALCGQTLLWQCLWSDHKVIKGSLNECRENVTSRHIIQPDFCMGFYMKYLLISYAR